MSLWTLYQNIFLPAQATLMRLEVGGIKVDLEKLKEMRAEAKQLHKDALSRIQEAAAHHHMTRLAELQYELEIMESGREETRALKGDTKERTKQIARQRTLIKQWGPEKWRMTNGNWTTLLFDQMGLVPPGRSKTKTGRQQVNDKVFEALIKKYPEVEALKWREVAVTHQKRAATQFGILVDSRGFTHPSYSLHRTATKRVASGSDTSESSRVRKSDAGNLQNIPPEDRVIYVPDEEGGEFLAADWSQIQALILFWFAKEERAVELIRTGDIHTYNAQILAESLGLVERGKIITREEAESIVFNGRDLRHAAKPMSYGVGFGLREHKAQREYGGEVKTWKRIIDATFEAWPGLRRFHDEVRREVEDTRRLRNPWGLIQWFHDFEQKGGKWKLSDEAFREAVAWKVQSCEAMMCLSVLPSLERLEQDSGRRLVTTTHDSFLLSVHAPKETHQEPSITTVVRSLLEREWKEMGTLLPVGELSAMQEPTATFSVKADLKRGRNWAPFHQHIHPHPLQPSGGCQPTCKKRENLEGLR